jgi:hypothetical protein
VAIETVHIAMTALVLSGTGIAVTCTVFILNRISDLKDLVVSDRERLTARIATHDTRIGNLETWKAVFASGPLEHRRPNGH